MGTSKHLIQRIVDLDNVFQFLFSNLCRFFLNLSSSAAMVCISFFPDCVIIQILLHSIIESQSAFSIFIILTDGKVDDIGASNEQV